MYAYGMVDEGGDNGYSVLVKGIHLPNWVWVGDARGTPVASIRLGRSGFHLTI